ncbi:MAG: hypothetical protein UR26_C0003G0002 [candidate division TM6 bacterium GW2011_GWF2_32_72]|nr:MAG: hypothetical protein UR26_C0003G0002 [candidate division TM6 bacterium GW2011_GWF2_32_72]
MKKLSLQILIICSLFTPTIFATKKSENHIGHSIFKIRSQGRNTARTSVGWQHLINNYEKSKEKKFYNVLDLSAEYSRSFNSNKIAKYLFNDSKIPFIGSQHPCFKNDGSQVMADNFGLSPNFNGAMLVTPKIHSWTADLNWYFGMDKVLPGCFFKVFIPLVYTKWDLNLNELPAESTGNPILPFCYMSRTLAETTATPSPNPLSIDMSIQSIREAFWGKATFGDMTKWWTAGKIDNSQSATRFADIKFELGCNIWLKPQSHIGIALTATAPTGNTFSGEYLFEPIAGNGGHFEMGGALSAHTRLWKSNDEQKQLKIFFEGNVSHLFSKTQTRSLGLKNCDKFAEPDCIKYLALNRYMLLKNFSSFDQSIGNIPGTGYKYTGELVNAINVVSQKNNVKIAINGTTDISIFLDYQHKNLHFNLGYNFFGRTKETIKLTRHAMPDCLFGLKGDSGVGMKIWNDTNPKTFEANSRLDSTHSNATIGTRGNLDTPSDYKLASDIIQNKDPLNAMGEKDNSITDDMFWGAWDTKSTDATQTIADGVTIDTTFPYQQLLCVNNLDTSIATSPSAMTNKIFGFTNYIFAKEKLNPFIGIGFFVEWDHKRNSLMNSLNQWGIWCKGGISF